MKIDVEHGWNKSQVIVGACKRKDGLSAQNAELYYRAMTEGGCKSLEDARAWVRVRQPNTRNTEPKRIFNEDDFSMMKSMRDQDIGVAADLTGLTIDCLKRHLNIMRRYPEDSFEEHKEHYRESKGHRHADEAVSAHENGADESLVVKLLSRLDDEKFEDLLEDYGITIEVRRMVVEVKRYGAKKD